MSDDLVKRLREHLVHDCGSTGEHWEPDELAREAAARIQALMAENARLREALKPFAKLFAMDEMGIFEANGKHEKDLTIAGEGGHLRPGFDLYAALRRARAARKGTEHE